VLVQEKNVGIEYEYNVVNNSNDQSKYAWNYTPWAECTASCAAGRFISILLVVDFSGTVKPFNLAAVQLCEWTAKLFRRSLCSRFPFASISAVVTLLSPPERGGLL